MLILYLFLLILYKVLVIIKKILYKRKINGLIKAINTKEDLLYLKFSDYMSVVIEVLKRYSFKVKMTDLCGIDGSGLKLNNIIFAEVWKHGLQQVVEVELAMNLVKCMQTNSIYRGMIITLGDFKPYTRNFCYKNVIECINGDQLLSMCKSVRNTGIILQPAK